MGLQTFQIICSIADLTAMGDIIKFRVPFTGTLKQIDLWTNQANTSGDNIFNLNVAGADLYSGGARPKIAQNQTHGQKSGLSDSLTFGDEIILQLETMATGGVKADLVLQLTIDDGVSVGGASAGNVFSLDAKPFSDVHPKSDYFESKTNSQAKWTEFQPQLQTMLFEDGRAKLIVPSNAGRVNGFFQSLPAGDCTIIAKFSTNAPKSDVTLIGLALFQDAALNPNTTDIIGCNWTRNTSADIDIENYADFATYTGSIGTDVSLSTTSIYLRVVRVTTTWTFSYSLDGLEWTTFNTTFTEGSYFTPKEFGVIAVNCVHSNENIFNVDFINYYDYPNAELSGGTIGGTPNSIVDKRVICIGDSIVRGYGVAGKDSFPHQLAALRSGVSVGFNGRILSEDDGSKAWKIINKGYDAYTTQNVIDKILPNTILRRNASLARDIVLVSVGTNDIVNGDSASTIYTKLTSLIASLKTAGFEVWLCTIIDRDGYGGFDAVRTALNTSINANTAGADQVVDLYANSNLQDASSSTYFQADGVHPKAAGMTVIAGIINALL